MPTTAIPTTTTEREASLPETVVTPVLLWQTVGLWSYLVLPFLALAGAIVLTTVAGVGPSLLDAGMAFVLYVISGHGITVGYHRYFTHRAFRARRPLRIALAVAGAMSVQGGVTEWVSNHRRHHAHADEVGDPHSPWRYGTSLGALTRGLWWAQAGWLFNSEETHHPRFAPDLLADRDIRRVDALFPLWAAISLGLPALVGGLVTGTWSGALSGLLWAGLVRMAFLHHVTWSVNSVCHVVGARPFRSRDKATNCWPLAVLSMGESWHNTHHADPTCARHGVDPGQLDSSALVIRCLERVGLATDVRWPDAERLDRKRIDVREDRGR